MTSEDIILRLVLSAIAGGIIGAEREYRNKSAGFRTLILISMGSCLFTIASMLIEENSKDRIASNIVTGIGFVGAGVIFKSETGVKGLTTAASVWITAAIGMAIAGGFYLAAGVTAFLVLVVLYVLSYTAKKLERSNVQYIYKVTFAKDFAFDVEYENFMRKNDLKFAKPVISKTGEDLLFRYHIKGSENKHDELLRKLIKDERIKQFESVDPN
ncbi:MAG TPA: MgtC/SapB family protein [Flavitalea sp.]|nr:MgtC/SapB family protein [Flavitalea sp.]